MDREENESVHVNFGMSEMAQGIVGPITKRREACPSGMDLEKDAGRSLSKKGIPEERSMCDG